MTQADTEVQAVKTAKPPARARAAQFWPWLLTLALLAGYAAYYGGMIWRSDAVPTFDQSAYVNKTYALGEVFWHRPAGIVNPWTYLGEPAANRPPLMIIPPALLLGPDADPRAIGIVWMLVRLGVLLGALRAIARRAGGGWWAPAAAAAILAAPGSLILYPNMYMMDQAFEAFGLLAFAWLAGDLLEHTPRSAARGALGIVLLLLVKPAALVFVFPLGAALLPRAWQLWRAERQAPWRTLFAWLWPYAAMALVLAVVLISPYGLAVVQQYGLGSKGYWATDKNLLRIVAMVALLLPPWMLAMIGLGVALRGLRHRGTHERLALTREQTTFVRLAGLTAGWWFVFNAFLTYTLDPRILPAAMPVAVVGALLVLGRSRIVAAAATVVAVATLALSVLAAQGHLSPEVRRLVNTVAPVPATQAPVTEVGLRPLARDIKAVIARTHGPVPSTPLTPPSSDARARKLMLLCHDDFVEVDALRLAMCYTGGNDGLHLDCFPWGSEDLDLEQALAFEWFLTKHEHKATDLGGDVWTNMLALDALVLDPASPLAGKFERVLEQRIDQPMRVDTVTLWRLKDRPTRDDIQAAYAFILPRYAGTRGELQMRRRLDVLGGK